ncbi:MAG: AAA family ATPase [Myxococcota bacterium]
MDRVTRIRIENVRAIVSADIEVSCPFTVLIGENGAGKSTGHRVLGTAQGGQANADSCRIFIGCMAVCRRFSAKARPISHWASLSRTTRAHSIEYSIGLALQEVPSRASITNEWFRAAAPMTQRQP